MDKMLSSQKFFWLLIDMFVFVFIAVFFGILIDYIFPEPTLEESFPSTLVFFLGQVILTTIIVYLLGYGYEKIVNRDPDLYYGFTMFIVIFFAIQIQLVSRLVRIYRYFVPSIKI